jgi:hypothetical protein
VRFAFFLLAVLVLSCLPGCFKGAGRFGATEDPPGPPDTALALQHRLEWALDSLQGIPRGCRLDSLGRLVCPELQPPRPK